MKSVLQGNYSLHFFYDAQSRPAKVSLNGVMYTYLHDLQGDIVGIVDSSGALVVEYKYDAWGRPIGTVTGSLAGTLGRRNPFRYRGYVWDEETGLYYLRSRYYNETTGRFVNADCECGSIGEINSHSLFSYCNNEPVDQADHSGRIGSFVANLINSVQEFFTRTLINTICGRKHASKIGEFSITSVTRNVTITTAEADSHNGMVSNIVSTIARIIGAVMSGSLGKAAEVITKLRESVVGGLIIDKITGAIQDEFASWFTVRAGTYTSIRCQYERNFKVLFFFPGIELHSYEIRIYPDYCEVWYSYMYSGFGSNVTIPQKIDGRVKRCLER